MLVGLVIAIVAYALGAQLWLALALGIGYAVIAFVITPRSAYVGGLLGPKPRPGEIPGPGSTREIDLTPEAVQAMTSHMRATIPLLVQSFGVDLVDASVGNIGWRQGQYAQTVVRLSDDFRVAAVERGKALVMLVQVLAAQSDDMREARIRFVDQAGRLVADATLDMSASEPSLADDESRAAAYAAAHTQVRERQ